MGVTRSQMKSNFWIVATGLLLESKYMQAKPARHIGTSWRKCSVLERDPAPSWVKQTSWLYGSRFQLFPCASPWLPEILTTQWQPWHLGKKGNGWGCLKNYISLHFLNRSGYFGKELDELFNSLSGEPVGSWKTASSLGLWEAGLSDTTKEGWRHPGWLDQQRRVDYDGTMFTALKPS